jgi:hypothetical protein
MAVNTRMIACSAIAPMRSVRPVHAMSVCAHLGANRPRGARQQGSLCLAPRHAVGSHLGACIPTLWERRTRDAQSCTRDARQ